MSPDQELRSLKRGLKVLDLMNRVEAIGITALARELDLPRTTAERIVSTLATEGYVQRLPHDKRYRLSSRIFSLSRGFSDESSVVDVATPLILSATRRIGWPLIVRTVREDMAVVRATSDPITSLSLSHRRVGMRVPLLEAGAGLLVYGYADASERAALLARLQASPHAVNRELAADRGVLARTSAAVLERGYALQPQLQGGAEQGLSIPILLDGRLCAVLEMIYIRRALTSSSLVHDYLPLLQALAAEIAARASSEAGFDDGTEEDELPDAITAMIGTLRERQLAFAV